MNSEAPAEAAPEAPLLSALLAAAALPVLSLDAQGRVVAFNRACERLGGLRQADVRGRRIGELLRDAAGRRLSDVLPPRLETRWRTPGGRRRRVEWRIAALADGGTLWVGADVTEQRELERGLLEVAESERRRLGQDLHDGLGQDLTAIALSCGAIQRRLAARRDAAAEEVGRLGRQVRRAIARAREVARGLYPAGLTADGLGSYVREAARRAEEASGVRCRVEWTGRAALGGETEARNLFAIVQEALTNALRHARPRRIWVRARRSGGMLRVTVRDDGRGFDPAAATEGMGLLVMKSRARALGGQLSAGRDPRGGALVECVVPLRRREGS